jgi:WD40 repeat protein
MGGLVIKKAFIIAYQHQDFQDLSRRVRSIFFLATPHRGADLATTFSKLLSVSSGARPFVEDLHRNSIATQSINDEFPQYCGDLKLYSFYESQPTSFPIGKGMIVDKDLAALGYPNERTSLLNANHREVCKYASANDNNYLTVRNALASIIDGFRNAEASVTHDFNNEHQKVLEGFLGVSDAPEDDFLNLDSRRLQGSCRWLMEKKSFLNWRDSGQAQLYWISAKPATGKSVLAAYIVKQLKEAKQDCAFYFFAYGDKVKATISSVLRSLAWQMAIMNPDILQTILDISGKDDQIGKAEYRTVWRKIFLDGILRVKLKRPLYWVIDGLDECKNEAELVPLLSKVAEICPIKILVTSRNRFESQRQVAQSKARVVSEEISADDTRGDIALYLSQNMEHLPSVDKDTHLNMVNTILNKSAGCFLWVTLVFKELMQVHTSTEIWEVLDDIPTDMDELYSRILASMTKAPHGKKLAKAILTWTICSARPLTTHELFDALQLDIKDKIANVKKSIEASCGQLVYIDATSRVQMVHQTAKDYLLEPENNSEFAVDKREGHKRLAMTCLQYLNGNEMKAPRHRRLSSSDAVQQRSPFVDYACKSLFEHIKFVSSTDEELLIALAKFLSSSNVLSCIEFLAQNDDLNRLIQTGKALSDFLRRRSKHMSPFGREVAILDSWSMDLTRLVTKFGKNLLSSPASIFNIIPPFCPHETAPRKQFASSTRGISVVGLSATTWDDCLSTIVYKHQSPSALACSDTHFAVGMSKGKIIVYHETTCQQAYTLQHQEPVKLLHFGNVANILISAGARTVRVWDIGRWEEVAKFDISQLCMSFVLTDDDKLLLGALKNNKLMMWDLTTYKLRDTVDWTQDLEGRRAHAFRRPTTAAFGMEQCLLAVVYRGQDILLWDLERDALYETFAKVSTDGKPLTNTAVKSLVFSSAPNTTLLAAAYWDGDLVLFDTTDGSIKEMVPGTADILACSPDGRTLASGSSTGTIELFDFETLKLLYRVNSEDNRIKSLAFSGDSHRLLDIRESQCRVWDPTALVRQDIDDENSDTVSISTAPQEYKMENVEETVLITSLACHESGELVFCGKEDGAVCIYSTRTGQQTAKLFSHAEGITVMFLCLENNILSSIDASSRILSHNVIRHPGGWEVEPAIFDYRTGVAIDQVLSNKDHTRLLVSSKTSDIICDISSGGSSVLHTLSWDDRGSCQWGNHPTKHDHLIYICDNVAHIYDWKTMQKLTGNGIFLEGSLLPELAIHIFSPCFNGSVIATAFSKSKSKSAESNIFLFHTSDFVLESSKAAPVPKYHSLADHIDFIIPCHGNKLVFLHSSGWVCSADSETSNGQYMRHFFLPADWLTNSGELLIEVTRQGDVIFVKRDEVAVIKRSLDTTGQSAPVAAGRRPSLKVPSITY